MRTSRWTLAVYLAIILCGIIALLPNFLSPQQLAPLPDWAAGSRVTLGLDLQGGSHLVLEVDATRLKASRLENLLDDANARLREARIGPASTRILGDSIEVKASTALDQDRSLAALRGLLSTVGATAIRPGTPEIDLQRRGSDTVVLRLTEAGQ